LLEDGEALVTAKLLTLEEAVAHFHNAGLTFHVQQLRGWCSRGTLPHVVFNRKRYVRTDVIDDKISELLNAARKAA
jgi:hypothetical protein